MAAVPQAVQEWQFPSSSSDKVYTVKRAADGALSCNCPGWTFKRGDRPRGCKHTEGVQARREVAALAKPKAAAPAKTATPIQSAEALKSAPAPMLASAMVVPVSGKQFDQTYAGYVMEEKHDGHRVAVRIGSEISSPRTVSAWSRPKQGDVGKPRELPAAMKAALLHLSPGVYDGELVSPGGNAWDVTAIGSRLVFVAFDLLEVNGADIKSLPYTARRDQLLDQLAKLPAGQKSVSTVEVLPVSWAAVEAIWKRGGEGVIVKNPSSVYRPGYRSPEWIKVKAKNAATLTVTGFEEGKSGPCSKFKLRDDEGHETTVKVLGNAMLIAVHKNPDYYIGRRMVISFQQRTPGGSYRHGQFDHFAGEGE